MRYHVKQRQQLLERGRPVITIRTLKTLPTREAAEAFLLYQSESFLERAVERTKGRVGYQRFEESEVYADLKKNERVYEKGQNSSPIRLPHFFVEEEL